MSGAIPPLSANSSVSVSDSCNDCCECDCWGRRREKKIAKDNTKFIAEMTIPKDSTEVYDLTVHVQPSPKTEKQEKK